MSDPNDLCEVAIEKHHKVTCPICDKIIYGAWRKSTIYKMEKHIKRHGKRKVAAFMQTVWDVDKYLMDILSFKLAARGEDWERSKAILEAKHAAKERSK